MQPTLAEIRRIAASDREGPDVMYYGEIDGNEYNFYSPADFFRDDDRYGPDAPDGNEAWPAWDTPAPGWFSRLPLPWYMSQFGADVTSTTEAEDLADGAPPVVIAYAEDNTAYGNTAEDIAPYLEGYERHRYQLYQWAEPFVIFVKSEA
jgi:predicted membrane-bound mannosyltransferase